MARVTSVQVGALRTLGVRDQPRLSGIDKRTVAGPVRLTSLGLVGDAIGNAGSHGGPDQAALLFSLAHYPHFEARLGRPLPPGSFGENLTVEGLDERTVRLGDVYHVGEARIEVTSARLPCATLAAHLADPGVMEAIRVPHRAGWYVRVLAEGDVHAGDALELLRAGPPEITVAWAADVRADDRDLEGARRLLGVAALSTRWRAALEKRLREAT